MAAFKSNDDNIDYGVVLEMLGIPSGFTVRFGATPPNNRCGGCVSEDYKQGYTPAMQMQCYRVCDAYVKTMVDLITEMFKTPNDTTESDKVGDE